MFLAAHRGSRLHAPENSFRALLCGYTAGAQAIEFDLQLTRDGHIVLCHDGTVARMTGRDRSKDLPSLRVLDLSLAQLRALDYSSGFAAFRNWDHFRYYRDDAQRVGILTLEEALCALPKSIPKLIEIKYDSTLETGRGDEMVDLVLETLVAHDAVDDCVLYALDRDVVRRVRSELPSLRMCAFDYKVPSSEQLQLLDETGADGLVLQLADVLTEDLELTELGGALAERFTSGSLRVGAVLYPFRGPGIPWIPTASELAALQVQPWAWSCASDSMIAVQDHVRRSTPLVQTSFPGRSVDTHHFALGYAKRNPHAHVFQDDGVHVAIDRWSAPASSDPSEGLEPELDTRVSRLEDEMMYARKTWPFYSGGGVGVRRPIDGDFVAELSYEVREPMTQAFTLEMAVTNVDPGEHQSPWNADGSRRAPREDDTFFDPHGAPPYVGVEHDEDDGFRINWNLGSAYENNRYGAPVGNGAGTQRGELRLERRGAYFSAYYRSEPNAPDWVCVGSVRNESMNSALYLRCVAKRWRQRSQSHESGHFPIPTNHVTFRHLQIHAVLPL